MTKRVTRAPDDYASLVRAAADGDASALERLLERAKDVAWWFSLSVCGRADDAEDAVQEALIQTYRNTRRIRDPKAFRPWLYRTVRNACLMNRRRKVDEPARFESFDEPATGTAEAATHVHPADPRMNPEQLAGNAALRRRLAKALQALPKSQRAVVFLRDMEGLSTREAAQVLRISEDNVKVRLHRARLALQANLRSA